MIWPENSGADLKKRRIKQTIERDKALVFIFYAQAKPPEVVILNRIKNLEPTITKYQGRNGPFISFTNQTINGHQPAHKETMSSKGCGTVRGTGGEA